MMYRVELVVQNCPHDGTGAVQCVSAIILGSKRFEYRLLLHYCWLALICAVYHVLLIDYCMRNDCERKAHIAGVEPASVLVSVRTCPMSFFSTVSQ